MRAAAELPECIVDTSQLTLSYQWTFFNSTSEATEIFGVGPTAVFPAFTFQPGEVSLVRVTATSSAASAETPAVIAGSPAGYECSLEHCYYSGYISGTDWGYYPDSPDCESCTATCTADSSCGGVECGTTYCSWWAYGSCALSDSDHTGSDAAQIRTCRQVDMPVSVSTAEVAIVSTHALSTTTWFPGMFL